MKRLHIVSVTTMVVLFYGVFAWTAEEAVPWSQGIRWQRKPQPVLLSNLNGRYNSLIEKCIFDFEKSTFPHVYKQALSQSPGLHVDIKPYKLFESLDNRFLLFEFKSQPESVEGSTCLFYYEYSVEKDSLIGKFWACAQTIAV